MFTDPASYRKFFEYVKWADRQQLDATRALSDEAYFKDHGWSFRTIHGVMLHQVSAQNVWLQRFQAQPMRWLMDEPAFAAREALEPAWNELHGRFDAFLATLTVEQLEGRLRFKNLKGEQFDQPLHAMLTHVMNHSTIHRGQLNSMIKLAGATPPAVDFSTWVFKTW